MRHILLSYTRTLDRVASHALQGSDLREAIYCFGCDSTWPFHDPFKVMAYQAIEQNQRVTPDDIELVARELEVAEAAGRAVWRRDADPSKVHAALNMILASCGLTPLNPNLPPLTTNAFLRIAIERVNNTNGVQRVNVIV